MPPASPSTVEPLVASRFAVDFANPLAGAGGGLPAFAAADRQESRADLMAVQVRRNMPARADALRALTATRIDGLLAPLAYSPVKVPGGEEAGFVICPAPPGPALTSQRYAWPEAELLGQVLRPAARTLDQLAQRRLTHRAIRPDNVFSAGRGQPVVLGCAWATPPAALQPAPAEPPYVAMCHPPARGSGTIADDVYALGVLLLTLSVGRLPLADLEDAEVVRRKLDLGSHAALVADFRISSLLGDLLRGMLAEDPEHRPPPALLLDFAAARSRRIAARPPHRAQRPIQIGRLHCWHTRSLAHALASEPEQGLNALKTGLVEHWLRRSLGDGVLAGRMEGETEIYGSGKAEGAADALVLLRAVVLLDPLAPLCWQGMTLWPDGIGPLLASAWDPSSPTDAEITGRVAALLTAEAPVLWGALRAERLDLALLRQETRQWIALLRLNGQAGGVLRLIYQLNPLLPCLSDRLDGRWVVHLAELLPALEAGARRDKGRAAPIGPLVAAFIAARGDRKLEGEAARLGDIATSGDPMVQLRLLTRLQVRDVSRPLPALGAWMAGNEEALLGHWNSRQRRADLAPRLRNLAEQGELAALLVLLEDAETRRTDDHEARLAAEELARVDAELAHISASGPLRAEQARRIGQEIAAGAGLVVLALVLLAAAFG